MSLRFAMTVFFAWISSSCGHAKVNPDRARQPRVMYVWIDADPRLDRVLTIVACNRWNVVNVLCMETPLKKDADVRVTVDDRDCRRRDAKGALSGTVTLAEAYRNGDVRMLSRCLDKTGVMFEVRQYAAVFAHEIGHVLGVWDHVAETCASDAPKHRRSGKRICGPALMNAYYHAKIPHVTPIDMMAYDERMADLKGMPEKMEDAGEGLVCVYATPAP